MEAVQRGPLRVAVYTIPVEKSKTGPAKPFAAAVLSDLHDGPEGRLEGPLRDALEEWRPEVIFCPGDQIVARSGKCRMERSLGYLAELARRCPVFCANGNHEKRLSDEGEVYPGRKEQYESALAKAGIIRLDNASAEFVYAGMRLRVYGADLPMECYNRLRRTRRVTAEYLREKLGMPEPGSFTVLLAHHPDFAREYARWGADLTLSGHVHGGIVRLPLAGGVFGSTFFPFPRYDRGEYLLGEGGRRMIVSAGLGSHTIPLRINNPPELVILRFAAR